MIMKGLSGGAYKPLQESDILKIHESSMEIFQSVGVEVNDPGALKIFADAGAKVDYNKKRFYATEDFVMKHIKKAPSMIKLCGRDEKDDMILGGTDVYLGTGGTALAVLDLDTKERRPTTLQDCRDTARIVDALDYVNFFVLPVYPTELDQKDVDINRFYAGLSNTTKHVMGGIYTIEGLRDVIKMGERIMGSAEALRERPIISFITCIMSPLKMDAKYTALMLEVIKSGLPLATPTAPISGMTSPNTLAGTLVQMNVEALSGVLLAQIVNPGTPVFLSYVPTTADMRSMSFLFGAVENGIMNACGAQLAQFYRLPVYATTGVTEAKTPDIQSGYEKMSTSLLAALAGANYIHDAAGLIESGKSVAYEQYVIDDEINGMIMRAVRGLEINDDTLATQAIAEVGCGGNYLSNEHTIRYMRSEYYMPQVANRSTWNLWEREGSMDGRDKARMVAKELLSKHYAKPIDEGITQELAKEFPNLILK